MAKKKKSPNSRSDADRRVRQCERVARSLKVLQCIMGPGRWDAEALAQECECSTRTIQRHLQVLAMAGVPFRYDPELRSNRVPSSYRFPGLSHSRSASPAEIDLKRVQAAGSELLRDGRLFMNSLEAFCRSIDEQADRP
ncbi:MAG: HTH domain-containing protein [Planctomycetales bacterium]|nr:HTH domain-containing protein [Planctomycetales bacterium]